MRIANNNFASALTDLRQLFISGLILMLAALILPVDSQADVGTDGNPHYNEIGFFDMHVCNWPDQPLFFLSLFSTTQYDTIRKIEVYDNNQRFIGQLNLDKYRTVMLKNPTREKHVFITYLPIPKTSGDGWYSTKVYLKDGRILGAKDYVIIYKMNRATGLRPAANASLTSIPTTFSWQAVPGAKYYQVFIDDLWSNKSVYSSELLTRPELTIPRNLLKRGGSYCWLVNARDTNEDVLLGDFNHGSLTKCLEFDINE